MLDFNLTPHRARITRPTKARYYSIPKASAVMVQPGQCEASDVIVKNTLFSREPRAVRLCKVTGEAHMVYIPSENVEVEDESKTL